MKLTRNQSAANSPAKRSISYSNKFRYIALPASILLALAVWQIAAWLVGSKLLLASPVDVIKRMFELVTGGEGFFATVGYTFARIALGFFLGLFAGITLAVLAGRFRVVEVLLYPYMITVKSIPVASFVILALIWLTSAQLASFVSFLMVLPVVYTNTLSGIKAVDAKLLEMAFVFKVPLGRRIKYVWIPGIKDYLLSACRISLGLAWKSGVAAELIGYPSGSVGERLYYSKVYFDTVDLFAWTAFIVLLSFAFEKIFMFAARRLLK